MTNVQRLQGTTVAYLGQSGKSEVKFVPQGQSATFNFGSNTVKTDNPYEAMGLSLSSVKASEPQGAEDDKKANDGAEAKKDGANVTVGNGNGTTIIIIGDGNHVNVDGTDKADGAEDVEDAEDAEDADKAYKNEEPNAENPNVQDPNKKVIDTLINIIKQLLDLIGVQTTKPSEAEEAEEPAKADEAKETPAEEPAKKPAAEDQNKKVIDTLKEVILKLLEIIQYQEPKKADEAKKEEEKPEAEQ